MTTTLPDIERALRLLRLSGVRDTLETRVLQAQGTQQPFIETFAQSCRTNSIGGSRGSLNAATSNQDSTRSSRSPNSTGPSISNCHASPASSCTR